MEIDVYGESRKGGDHPENEDAILINKDKNLFAVADGITLPFGGKEASTRASFFKRKKSVGFGQRRKAYKCY